MKHTSCDHENFWFLYKMINFSHSFKTSQKCPDCGKKISLKLRGEKQMKKNFVMRIFMTFMWMAPVFLILFFSSYYMESFPWNYIFAASAVIVYHFAAMYAIIRGPLLKLEVKK